MRGDRVRLGAPVPYLDFRGGMRFDLNAPYGTPPTQAGRDMPQMGSIPLDPDGTPAGPVLLPDGNGGYRNVRKTFVARVSRDGTVNIIDKPNFQSEGAGCVGCDGATKGLPGWQASFDLTDAIMRANGEDPYRYEKQKFLEETFELRTAMAAEDRLDRLEESVRQLPELLDRIWRYDRWSAAERRRVIFTLWDDCAEEGDEPILAASAAARRHIIGFIHSRLPADGADAYQATELAELNATRRSAVAFDPYVTSSP
jgi:hypothetical protein